MGLFLCSSLSCNVKNSRVICEDENQDDYQESVTHFTKEIEADPKDEQSIYALGMSQYKLGKYENAETTFTNLININSEYPAAYLNRGLCRFFQDDQSGACEDFKSSIKLGHDPTSINDEKVSKYVQDNCAV